MGYPAIPNRCIILLRDRVAYTTIIFFDMRISYRPELRNVPSD